MASATMEPQPGLLFAQSRITDTILDEATFTRWYEEKHVPDLLATSKVDRAFRFMEDGATSPTSESCPYLAMYTIPDLSFLGSKEFTSIPMTSDNLPNPSKDISDVANFDGRQYEVLGAKPGQGSRELESAVILVDFKSAEKDSEKLFTEGWLHGSRPTHSTLLKVKPWGGVEEPGNPRYLVIHEFDALPLPAQTSTENAGAKVSRFRPTRVLGHRGPKW